MSAAAGHLADALRGLWGPLGCERLMAVAELADVSGKIARMAARGRCVSVDHHLRLSAAVGFDPYIEARKVDPFALGRFNRADFGQVVRRYRKDDRHQDIHSGAADIGISVRALSFIENGRVVSIDATLAACRYVGIHPFAFARNRFTGNTGCNPLTQKVAA